MSEKTIKGFSYEISGSGRTLTIKGTGAIPVQDDPKDYPWNDNDDIERIILSEGITVLPYGALRFLNAESIKLPDSLTTIEKGVFGSMCSLKHLRLGKNVINIDSGFFSDSVGNFGHFPPELVEINVSKENPAYTTIGGVLYTKDLKTLVRFPVAKQTKGTYMVKKGVEKIAPYAFSLVGEGLKEIIFPSTVKELGKGVFEYSQIERIDLSLTNITEIPEDAFSSCMDLKNISLPDTVKVINRNALFGTENEEIIVPEGVERIEEEAFRNSSLRKISLPSTIKYIGKYAFANDNLKECEAVLGDRLFVTGSMADSYNHENVTIEEEGNEILLNDLYYVPDCKGQIHFWEVEYCYGLPAGYNWTTFKISCTKEEFNSLQRLLSAKQNMQDIGKIEKLKPMLERIRNRIENIIIFENNDSDADWLINDDGDIEYKLKGFEWEES